MSTIPISEDDLHAYVDSALPADRRTEVEAFLALHPEDAERVREYQQQIASLKALFDPVLGEPIPESLRALASAHADAPRPNRLPRWSLQRFAASIAIAAIGGLIGWWSRGSFDDSQLFVSAVPLSRQAAVAHAVFSPEVRRPVEVSGENEDQLVTWLSKRIGKPVKPPKLGGVGFELVGGRLLPGNSGPVAQFMYQNAKGQRLTLYVSTENTRNRETAFRFAQEGPVNVFYWIDGSFGYALSASIDKAELAELATVVYHQIEGPGK